MKRKIIMVFAFSILYLSLVSCNGADNMGETGHDIADDNVTSYDPIDWENDPTIGKVQTGRYKRIGITKKNETYEEMLELRDIGNKGYLTVCDDGTAFFDLDGEKTEYTYDEYSFYLTDDTERSKGMPYVYIGGRIVFNDGSTITQYLKLSAEEF